MSDDSKFKLLAAFRHIGQQIDLSSFKSRLIFQKQVYLLQELGVKLGYSYGWYLHGPYSREVTSDGFRLENIQNQIANLPQLSTEELGAIQVLQELVSESAERFTIDDTDYCMELLGSLHFVMKHGYPKPASREEALRRFCEKLKPSFSEDAETALELLIEKNLI